MNRQTTDEILAATEHLPSGATLVVHQIGWDDYEHLLEGLEHRRVLRTSYDSGKLEIMSPSSGHGWYERLIEDLVLVFCEVFHLPLQKYGHTTWKRRSLAKGVEPDASYYVENASRMIGKRNIDLESDPPPDFVLEVDVTRSSLARFSIFAALGISEVWRYDGKTCKFYTLTNGQYIDATGSRFLPHLTGEMIATAIEISKTSSQDETRKSFRRRIRALKKSL